MEDFEAYLGLPMVVGNPNVNSVSKKVFSSNTYASLSSLSSPPPLFYQQPQTGKSVAATNPNHCHMLCLSHPPPTSLPPRTTDSTTHHFKVPTFFLPPLWERYQQQVKEWELDLNKNNANIPNGCQEQAAPIEKPSMFALCLKRRGLEVPNKGSKQRSRRKFSISGESNAILH
ncbi:hypothetical protein CFP56_017335 [Quercus suber]|uniref:Uncharacterized protein n=1 Tax=Quercus suber TaxID=58331 RepID=A0AAW0KMU2_QUESU